MCLCECPVPSAFLLDTGPCEWATSQNCSIAWSTVKINKHLLRECLLEAGRRTWILVHTESGLGLSTNIITPQNTLQRGNDVHARGIRIKRQAGA